MKARGQDVEQKAADEFAGGERRRLRSLRGIGTVVLVGEADAAILDVEQPVIGNRHAMSVATDVVEDLLWAAEWPLGVDDPFGLRWRKRRRNNRESTRTGKKNPGRQATHCVKSELGEHFESNGDAKMELFDYIEVFYNQRRRHSTIGYVSPAVFEQRARSGFAKERCA